MEDAQKPKQEKIFHADAEDGSEEVMEELGRSWFSLRSEENDKLMQIRKEMEGFILNYVNANIN